MAQVVDAARPISLRALVRPHPGEQLQEPPQAFREVADGLVEYRKTVEQREQQQKLVDALRETVNLSTLRYKGGLDSYLQVLDAQRNLFQGDLTLARLRQRELSAIVQLYRALGGEWPR